MGLIVRFRSKDGMYRLSGEGTTMLQQLIEELVLTKLPPIDPETLAASVNGSVIGNFSSTLSELGFVNGQMVELTYSKVDPEADRSLNGKATPTTSAAANINISSKGNTVNQLPVDNLLDEEKGLIPRERSSLCKHTAKGMCEYCSPLPPWDGAYHAEHNIKHISYHSHLSHLNSEINHNESSSYIPPLQSSDFKVKNPCPSGHSPWPKGICSKCQPSGITLKRQTYRMIDHVEFQNSIMMNSFIDAWRKSGVQRIGLLLGTYDKYQKTPLGIKAKVEAIYEFPQHDWDDGIKLEDWIDEEKVVNLCNNLGLMPLGVIFTDLSDAGNGDGSVICKRHADSFFLSSLEIIFAVNWQLKYPNIAKYSETGFFSSKFVTCVITGNLNGEIDINCYQASETAEALVKADLICASTHPNQMFIKEQTNERYVPDIMYQMINEYGLEVKKNAKPSFPVEYLLVSLTHGFPEEEGGMFAKINGWQIENRGYLGELAGMEQLKKILSQGISLQDLQDWHLLLWLGEQDVLSKEEFKLAVDSVREGNSDKFQVLLHSAGWRTLETICSMS
ncbi:nuclear protein localization protein 4 [Martiniozyma asiatica (nom. inval.)]|nr:nuclear protein localization protein 4 [Martiniozyma asiatica]